MPLPKNYKKENPKVSISITLEKHNLTKVKKKSVELYGKENVSKLINYFIENGSFDF